jgi:hypothetical protein
MGIHVTIRFFLFALTRIYETSSGQILTLRIYLLLNALNCATDVRIIAVGQSLISSLLVDVGNVADVSEVNVTPIFMIEMIILGGCWCIYMFLFQ